jgi:hypothetical protein
MLAKETRRAAATNRVSAREVRLMSKTCSHGFLLAASLVGAPFSGCPRRKPAVERPEVGLKTYGSSMDNMVLRRLGSVSPGRQLKEGSTLGKNVVDMNPIVLWAGDKPAAIL